MNMEEEKIKQRRSQMLVHSYLYYELNTSIISDAQFDKWAKELADMGYQEIGFYDKLFKDWDGSSGFHLSFDGFIRSKAEQLLAYEAKR